jgi:hypothetical protein
MSPNGLGLAEVALDVDPVPALAAEAVLRLGVSIGSVEMEPLRPLLVAQRVVVLPLGRFPPAPDPVGFMT